jgi:hypothetical protein
MMMMMMMSLQHRCLFCIIISILGNFPSFHTTVDQYVKAVPYRYADANEERSYSFESFLNSALDGGELSASRPGRALPPDKGPPGTHYTGGWVGLRAGLDTEDRGKIVDLCRGSNPGRPVRIVRHHTD